MSNDAKFWMWRIVIVIDVIVGMYILGKIRERGMAGGEGIIPWIVALFVLFVISIPLGFMHALTKRRRWESTVSPFEDLEPLNAYAKLQAEDKTKATASPKEQAKK
jgi:hypothetical protein